MRQLLSIFTIASVVVSSPAQTQTLFGVTSTQGGSPGSLISAESLGGAPEGSAAYRVLYRSTGLRRESIPVLGMIIVPPGPLPLDGRSIVAWAHPTTGVVPRCAPSLARKRFQMIAGLRLLLARGYAVAVTDYPGLGTDQVHPYLVGESEGRAVLDAVRAAQQISGIGAGQRFVVWGHSQGGQAALFAGILAGTYAPDLQLLGVAAAAPATELATLMKADLDTSGGKNLTAMTLWSWARIYNAPTDTVLDPSAIPAVDQLASECLESIYDVIVRRKTSKGLEKQFLRVDDFAQAQPWATLLAQNTPGPLPPHIPVFLAQGATDNLVLPRVTRDYFSRLCRNKNRVVFLSVPNTGHGFVAFKASNAAVAWMNDRFAGAAAPTSCSE